MARLYTLVLLASFLSTCVAKTKRREYPEIIIEVPVSYKWDLKKEVFTVSFASRRDTLIKFHLSADERNRITDRYYDLGIGEITGVDPATGTILIKDECMIMPKLYTRLHLKTKTSTQHIQIDEGCDDFYRSNFSEAARIKTFLQFIMTILRSKPEIKNAPASDIMYL